MALGGYARVSTGDQNPDLQRDALVVWKLGRSLSLIEPLSPRLRCRPASDIGDDGSGC